MVYSLGSYSIYNGHGIPAASKIYSNGGSAKVVTLWKRDTVPFTDAASILAAFPYAPSGNYMVQSNQNFAPTITSVNLEKDTERSSLITIFVATHIITS